MISVIASMAGRFILAPLASLWRWLTAEPIRLAFFALIALCAFIAWRLASVDGDRDKWRNLAKQYEAASKIVKDADDIADAEALVVAAETKGSIDAQNDAANDAARNNPSDPLGAAFGELRRENRGGGNQAPR